MEACSDTCVRSHTGSCVPPDGPVGKTSSLSLSLSITLILPHDWRKVSERPPPHPRPAGGGALGPGLVHRELKDRSEPGLPRSWSCQLSPEPCKAFVHLLLQWQSSPRSNDLAQGHPLPTELPCRDTWGGAHYLLARRLAGVLGSVCFVFDRGPEKPECRSPPH